MPDLDDDRTLVDRMERYARHLDGHVEADVQDASLLLREAAARLAAAAEERQRMHQQCLNADQEVYRADAALTAAAERERGLREALRPLAIQRHKDFRGPYMTCALCERKWEIGDSGEHHAPDCLAALAAPEGA